MEHSRKIFTIDGDQAVWLPPDCQFDVGEVFIRRDQATGDVILSKRPATWDGFFEAVKDAEVPADFLSPEERDQGEHRPDPFEGWEE